jgi:DNA repair and recombination RAD54-like protein
MQNKQNLSTEKWLGEGAISPLAVDGKGGKADLLEAVARWVAARGRNVTQPGKNYLGFDWTDTLKIFSYDCFL